jgi:hypothetical protein
MPADKGLCCFILNKGNIYDILNTYILMSFQNDAYKLLYLSNFGIEYNMRFIIKKTDKRAYRVLVVHIPAGNAGLYPVQL